MVAAAWLGLACVTLGGAKDFAMDSERVDKALPKDIAETLRAVCMGYCAQTSCAGCLLPSQRGNVIEAWSDTVRKDPKGPFRLGPSWEEQAYIEVKVEHSHDHTRLVVQASIREREVGHESWQTKRGAAPSHKHVLHLRDRIRDVVSLPAATKPKASTFQREREGDEGLLTKR